MRCQQGLRAPSRAISKERRFLAGNLEYRGTKRTYKAFGIARAKSGARPAGYDDDCRMSILPPRITQYIGLRGVRWNFSKPNKCIAFEISEETRDACRTRETAVEEWQSLDLHVVHHERGVNRINSVEREFLTHRFKADLAHLIGQPVPGYLIYCRACAVESLLFVGANNRANASLHTPTPVRVSGHVEYPGEISPA